MGFGRVKMNEVISEHGLTNISCEGCAANWSWHITLLGCYPAHLCDDCRREFQFFIMNDIEYKALCAVGASPPSADIFHLQYDIQKGIYPKLESWFDNKKKDLFEEIKLREKAQQIKIAQKTKEVKMYGGAFSFLGYSISILWGRRAKR